MIEMNQEDKDLKEIFSGEDKPLHPDTVHITLGKAVSKKETTTTKTEKSAHKPTHDFKDGKWEPVKENTWMDNLKDCARWVIGFGGLSFLVFYWMETGLMAESVAVPSIAICTMLAGFSAGRCARRGQ
jgi:hypothetical protein